MTVPGPGPYSQRTDTGGQPIRDLPDPSYGEATDYREQQKGAPLAQAEGLPPGPYPSDLARMAGSGGGPAEGTPAPMDALPSIFDPGDPSIPVTAGAPLGPGPNEIPMARGSEPHRLSQQLAQYAGGDGSDGLAWLVHSLSEMGQ